MIRVAALEGRPLIRLALEGLLDGEPDLAAVGFAADRHGLEPLLDRCDPDLLLLDGSRAALPICMRIKRRPRAPRVVIQTDGETDLAAAAALAGADAVVDRTEPTRELLTAIRAVAAGERVLPPLTLWAQARAAAQLDASDLPIFAMRLAGTPLADIAATLGIGRREVAARLAAMLPRVALS
jgi:two-component system, NarL family, response regulator DesR